MVLASYQDAKIVECRDLYYFIISERERGGCEIQLGDEIEIQRGKVCGVKLKLGVNSVKPGNENSYVWAGGWNFLLQKVGTINTEGGKILEQVWNKYEIDKISRWKYDWRCKYWYFQKKYGNNSRRNMKGNGSVVTMNGGKMTGEEGGGNAKSAV